MADVSSNVTNALVDCVLKVQDVALESTKLDAHVAMALLDYASVTRAGFSRLAADPKLCSAINLLMADGASGAACACGLAAHWLELDDGYRNGGVHIGAPVISALITYSTNEDWRRLVASVACGYEAAGILAEAMRPRHKRRGFHTTGTCGSIGAAAALAICRKMNRSEIKLALSIASNMASGLLEMQEDGSRLKPTAAGNAASCGVRSVMLAESGLSCPEDAIGGPRGMIACMDGESRLLGTNADNPVITRVYRKPYPSCRHSHSAIDAAFAISHRPDFDVTAIETIEIATYSDAIRGHDSLDVRTAPQAMMSTPFCVAAMLATRNVSLKTFTEEELSNPLVHKVLSRINMVECRRLTELSPEKRGSLIRVSLADGSVIDAEVVNPKGEPENPLSADELKGKCVPLLVYGGLERESANRFANSLLAGKGIGVDELRAIVLNVESTSA